jgi:hypothetical protein
MKCHSLVATLLISLACSTPKSDDHQNSDGNSDTTQPAEASSPRTTLGQPDTVRLADELFMQEGDTALEISTKKFSVGDPFAFKLNAADIKARLGAGTISETEDIDAIDQSPSYTISTITKGKSMIRFSSIGNHEAEISTSLLPLKNEIKVGMSKSSFIQRMAPENIDARKASLFKLYDDYGYINFYFKADTLNNIVIFYEQGD